MKIWIDADACPVQIRDLISRAAARLSVNAVFIANKRLAVLQSEYIAFVQVNPDPDAADAYIAEHSATGDLVVTHDIPLAALLVPRGIVVISPRGSLFTEDNIADQLSRRDLMHELRDIGAVTSDTPRFDETIKRQFANHFNAALHRLMKQSK
jgi:uncharacterized protein YaiI (UPF0178 family)